jgi:hypothetical protein
MTQPNSPAPDSEISRVRDEIAGQLRRRNIDIPDSDTPEDVVNILEAVEAFEKAVEAKGGDLMMDEPPTNQRGEPDDPHFLLPTRNSGESANAYVTRLSTTTSDLRKHPPQS